MPKITAYDAVTAATASDIFVVVQGGETKKTTLATMSATIGTIGADKVTITDDSPELILKNNTPEDKDDGRESTIIIKGLQSGSEETTLAKFLISHDGTSDDQKGKLGIYLNDGADDDTPTQVLYLDSSGNLGVGLTPLSKFHVNNECRISRSIDASVYGLITLEGGNFDLDAYGTINHVFKQAGTQTMRVSSGGNLVLGNTYSFGTNAAKVFKIDNGTAPTTSPADSIQMWSADTNGTNGKAGLHIRTEDGTSHVFGDKVGIGTITPAATLTISGSQSIKRTDAGAADYNPSALTTDYLITADNTAAARAITISTEDVQSGTTTLPRIFTIKDEYGSAGTYNLTITLENSGTIDGAANAVLSSNYDEVSIYCTGTNAFIGS